MKKKVFEYFAHPVFQYKVENYENHNEALLKYILELNKEESLGQKLSNINGWHSPFFNLQDN